jgi:predicted Co/Zn/Cd cation transporter (cation efflux family)
MKHVRVWALAVLVLVALAIVLFMTGLTDIMRGRRLDGAVGVIGTVVCLVAALQIILHLRRTRL